MHTLFKRCGCALVLYAMASWVQAQVLFACEPEWAALAQVLMPQARVHIATLPTQDPHHIEARPALIAQMRNADMALCTGAALEEGWLPVLQQKSGNPKVQNGQPGMFWATEGQTLLGRVNSSGSPFEGDVHPQGNPHVQANPQRLAQVARDLARRMANLWPDQAPAVQERLQGFEQRWQAHMARWQRQAQGLRGKTVAAQHTYFTYLWEWLGMTQVADLEPKPGLTPSPAHLQQVMQRLRDQTPRVWGLAVVKHQDPRAARWMQQQLPGLTVWSWQGTVGQATEEGLVQWFDLMLTDLNKGGS